MPRIRCIIYEYRPVIAKLVAEQVFDNALIAAGLLEDSRFMLPRLNDILEGILDEQHSGV